MAKKGTAVGGYRDSCGWLEKGQLWVVRKMTAVGG